MKLSKLFYALGIGAMLTACSSNDDLAPDQKGETGVNAKYVSVSIVTSDENGTRAENDPYQDGEPAEYDVQGIMLYFFDNAGACVYQDYIGKNKITFSDPNAAEKPNVTTIGTIEVELKANADYHSVVAVLNPTKTVGQTLNFDDLDELKTYMEDYGKKANGTGDGRFTMANSVYYDVAASATTLANKDKFVEVPITSSNIYTKTGDAATDAQTRADRAIDIYVERVCAKVEVVFDPSNITYKYAVKKADGTTTDVIEVMTEDGTEGGKLQNYTVSVDFKGAELTVIPNKATTLKHFDNTPKFNFCDHVTNFKWNNPTYKRSHWEDTLDPGEDGYEYKTWKEIGKTANFTYYLNPNTTDATHHNYDICDYNTKLIVKAQLTIKDEEGNESHDLVRFSDGYWIPSMLIKHTAHRIKEALNAIDVASLKAADGSDLTPEQKTAATAAIKAIDVEKIQSAVSIDKKPNTDPSETEPLEHQYQQAYLAQLLFSTNKYNPVADIENETVKSLILKTIDDTLNDITARQVEYWKDGMTYYYAPIRHQGFTGLGGDNNGNQNFLNAVVRNHWYKVGIEGVYGLGTPVISPDDPIDPERPKSAPPSYITAKIHVLKWKMVKYDMTLH